VRGLKCQPTDLKLDKVIIVFPWDKRLALTELVSALPLNVLVNPVKGIGDFCLLKL